MTARMLNALLAVALVFAGARLWRFLGEPPPQLPSISAVAPAPAAPQLDQGPVGTDVRPEAYDVIVARDLFSPTRGIVPPAPATAAKPIPKPLPPPKLTLYGVVILDGEKTAYLQEGAVESRPRKVREKESFAGGVVSSIRPDGVTFLFAGSEINVPLRTPKDGAAVAAPGVRDTGNAGMRPDAPMAFPRRPAPTNLRPGQVPAPVRPVPAPPSGSPAYMPGEPGSDGDGEEAFPEGMGPEGMEPGADAPNPPDEELGE